MSTRFYINCPLRLGPIELDGPEAHHLVSVCRLRPGDAVCLFNGDGQEYTAKVVAAARRTVSLEIDGVVRLDRELPFRLEVAAPLPKGDRAQFLIEKLTELGATAFVPLECERSVVHPREAKLEKMERYVVESSKQCGRNVLMLVLPPMRWTDYCVPRPDDGARWVAHPAELGAGLPPGRRSAYRIAVGPEGGFADHEIDAARQHGWAVVNLGPRILRMETAALVLACRAVVADQNWSSQK